MSEIEIPAGERGVKGEKTLRETRTREGPSFSNTQITRTHTCSDDTSAAEGIKERDTLNIKAHQQQQHGESAPGSLSCPYPVHMHVTYIVALVLSLSLTKSSPLWPSHT